MSDEELKDVVLKNRDYFENAIRKSLWNDVAYDYRKFGSIVLEGLADWDWWIQTAGFFALLVIAPIALAVSPVWLPLKSWLIRRRIYKILNQSKP